jgi:predicted RNA-binding Zn-ribbon protein involved in translation (DUF1610 family)
MQKSRDRSRIWSWAKYVASWRESRIKDTHSAPGWKEVTKNRLQPTEEMTTSTPYLNNSSTNYQPDTPSDMVYSADGLPIHNPEGDVYASKNNQMHMGTPAPVECAPPARPHDSTTGFPPSPGVGVQVLNPKYVYLETRKPVTLTYCPHCAKQNITTQTRTKVTGTTWACFAAGVLIFWPLCWIPFVVKPMKQTNHYCSNCGVKVGRVKPFQ